MRRALIAGLAIALLGTAPARSATVIRDAEVEATVGQIAKPIFRAARLSEDDVRVVILRDDRLNAFVANGQNLFLNTGLLIRTETPDQLAGVIAHETGHIAGGHLSRSMQARERATYESLIGAMLGVAAAAAGAPAVGTAMLAGGATLAQRGFLSFSRVQEQAADQAGISFLAANHESARGMIEFFRILQNQNLGISADANEFLRTHPLTATRIAFIENQVEASPYKDVQPSPALVEAHARMVAKLDGFLADPVSVLRRRSGTSLPDRYAQAVAYYRQANPAKATAILDGLIAEHPDDPYFPELKGQILFESGKIAAAEAPYREAVRLLPGSALIRVGLARTLMEQGQPAKTREAATLLDAAVRLEPRNAGTWRFLGIAQGQLGEEGRASVALAESAVLTGEKNEAELNVRRAQALVKPSDPEWLHVQDLVRAVDEMPEPERPSQRPQRR